MGAITGGAYNWGAITEGRLIIGGAITEGRLISGGL